MKLWPFSVLADGLRESSLDSFIVGHAKNG